MEPLKVMLPILTTDEEMGGPVLLLELYMFVKVSQITLRPIYIILSISFISVYLVFEELVFTKSFLNPNSIMSVLLNKKPKKI